MGEDDTRDRVIAAEVNIKHNTETIELMRTEFKEGMEAIRHDLGNGLVARITQTIQDNMPKVAYGQLSGNDRRIIYIAILSSVTAIVVAVVT